MEGLIMAPEAQTRARRGAARRLPWLGLSLLLIASPAWSATVIEGTVLSVLDRHVAGAQITISHQGQPLQEGVTNAEGRFSLEIEFGDVGNLDLIARHSDYVPNQIRVRIASFEPTDSPYTITLMPKGLKDCAGVPGAIIVGKFLPPRSTPNADLIAYVERVLSFQILPKLQAAELKEQLDVRHKNLVPQFLKCEGAAPSTENLGKVMAQALGGQGLVWGAVIDADTGFDINAFVADAHGVLDSPINTTSREVDIDHAEQAVVSPMIRAALLVGVMANLEDADQCQAAIYVSNVVRRLIPAGPVGSAAAADWQKLTKAEQDIRSRCQLNIPHAGLLGGGF